MNCDIKVRCVPSIFILFVKSPIDFQLNEMMGKSLEMETIVCQGVSEGSRIDSHNVIKHAE
jgi:hypothetical protein